MSWNKSSLIDLNPFIGEFWRTLDDLVGIQFSHNVFLPVPRSHRYFAVLPSTRAYKTDSYLVRFERLAAAEWFVYLGVSYLKKICIRGTAIVLEVGTIGLMERFHGAFPPMPVSPAFTGVCTKSTVVWDGIIRFERLALCPKVFCDARGRVSGHLGSEGWCSADSSGVYRSLSATGSRIQYGLAVGD